MSFFSEGWRLEKPEAFIRHFSKQCVPDVRMVQPMAPTTHDIDGFARLFRGLFKLFPDYEVRVEDWASRDNIVFLWLQHSTTIGRRRTSWPGVDRIILTADGLISERVALFDPTRQLSALVSAPSLWPRLVRFGLALRSG